MNRRERRQRKNSLNHEIKSEQKIIETYKNKNRRIRTYLLKMTGRDEELNQIRDGIHCNENLNVTYQEYKKNRQAINRWKDNQRSVIFHNVV